MFCQNCGAKCEDGERFCPSCGISLELSPPVPEPNIVPAPEAPSSEGSRRTGRKPRKTGRRRPGISHRAAGAAAVVLAAAVVVALALGLLGGGGDDYGAYSSSRILSLCRAGNSEMVFYCGGKELGAAETGYVAWSQDGSVGAFVNSGGELCVVTGKGIDTAADDVSAYQLSANGGALLYVTGDYDVCWYDVGRKSTAALGSGEAGAQLGQAAPDGSAAVYTLYDGGSYEGFVCGRSGKPASLGEGVVPFAVSNKGTYLYYVKVKSGSSGTLCVSKGAKGEEVKLAEDYTMDSVLFNRDATQMLFSDSGKTYLTVKGGDGEKAFSASLYSMFTPDYTVGSTGGVVPASDLRGQTYYTSGGVYFLDSKGESKKITSGFEGFALSSDGSSLIYQRNGGLVKVTSLAKGIEEELTDDGEVSTFRATRDLSAVYYLDRDGELYYQKGGGKPVKICGGVDAFLVAPDGRTCVGISDGQLFVSTGGKSTSTPHDLDKVTSFAVQRGELLICQDAGSGRADVYTMSGAEPELLAEGFEGDVN